MQRRNFQAEPVLTVMPDRLLIVGVICKHGIAGCWFFVDAQWLCEHVCNQCGWRDCMLNHVTTHFQWPSTVQTRAAQALWTPLLVRSCSVLTPWTAFG